MTRTPVRALLALLLVAAAVAAAGASARTTADPANTGEPRITGTTTVGGTLTVSNGSWSNSPTSFTYQWYRCDNPGKTNCQAISGQTSNKYTLTSADAGHTFYAQVTACNKDGCGKASADAVGPVSAADAPANTAAPTISGNPDVGQTLTASNGSWSNAPSSYAYQWLRCGSSGDNCGAIGGATSKTYVVTTADRGATLRVRVTATNSKGTGTATSATTGVVTGGTTTTTTTPRAGGCVAGSLRPPARLLIDRWTFEPRVVTPETQTIVARFHVIEVNQSCGVAGARIWATAIPYNQISVEQTTTGADGWATVTFSIGSAFPANPRNQQILAILVRATQPGGSTLAGVSTRRVLAEHVRLH
jgi:hypothetical protein